MKRKFLTMLLSSAMIATMLVGCGNEPTTTQEPPKETTQDVVEETTTQEETQEAEESTTQEETQEVEEITTQEEFGEFIVSHSFDGGYVDEYQNPNNEELSDYDVYVNNKGNDIYFTFTGVKGLGEMVLNDTDYGMVSLLTEDETHRLNIWNGTVINEDYMKNYSQEDIMAASGVDVDASTYQVDETNNTYRVMFKTSNSPGFVCFIDNFETNRCYQFTYFERDDIFDDTRIKNTVESIVTGEENFHPIQ